MLRKNGNDLALLTGRAHPALAKRIAAELRTLLLPADVGTFRDRECRVKHVDDTRGKDVHIIQPTCQPDRNKTEIQLLVSGIRRSAERITVVIPYFGYSRQDRRGESRQPISMITMLRDIVDTGIDGIVFFHLHNPVTAGFADAINPRIKTDHLNARPIVLEWLLGRDLAGATLASTDTGGGGFVRSCCERLWKKGIEVEFGVGYKLGSSSVGIEKIELFGEYNGRDVFFIDDQSQSGDTINRSAAVAKKKGARSVTALIIHPVIPDKRACFSIANGSVDQFVTTDTLNIPRSFREILGKKLVTISAAKLLALSIWHLHCGKSMTHLFELEGYFQGLKEMREELRA